MTLSVDAALRAFAPALPLAVGLSGGADSTALLLACARRWPGRVQAIHVHHGLQAAADAFEAHCAAVCRAWDVPLSVQRVHAQALRGQSPEDAARQARYKAFDAVVKASSGQNAIKSVAIAHNADDQIETVLLALTRGAGMAGLAAMPAHWERAGVPWHRPLLQVSAAHIRDWLRSQGQAWVEDPTNTDERFTRNRIRAQLLPALEAAFPSFRDTWSRSASHAAQAVELLEELAQQDLVQVGVPPRIALLRVLGRARQANVLRCWLRVTHGTVPSTAQLAELLDQIAACSTRGHRIRIKVGRGFVGRSGAHLEWSSPEVLPPLSHDQRQLQSVAMRFPSGLAAKDTGAIDKEAKRGMRASLEEKVTMESAAVSGITVHREEAKISVLGGQDPTGIAHQILSALGNARVEVGLIIQNVSRDGKTDVSFTLHRKDCARTLDTLREKVLPASGAREVVGDTTICKVSIVDASMGSPLDVASRMFRVLSDEGIQIQMIATSDSGASVVIGEQHLDLAVRSLRRSFPTDQDAT